MVALAAGSSSLDDNASSTANQEKALPADLAWVPADAVGFLSVRLADLWQSPTLKTFRAQLAKEDPDLAEDLEKGLPKAFEQFLGVGPKDVERITLALQMPFPGSVLEVPMSVTTVEPLDRAKLLRTLDGGMVEKALSGGTYAQGRTRGVLLQFINDRSYMLWMPRRNARWGGNAALEDALRVAATKHTLAGGLLPSALLEQIEETSFRREPPLASFVLATNPLFLARSAAVTLDLGENSRLEMRLLYRKEATAAAGEEALRASLGVLGRWLNRELATGQGPDGPLPARLLRRLADDLQNAPVEQQGKTLLASLELKADLTTALLQTIAQAPISSRRLQSQNNLKQLAIAMHNYHDTYGYFPPAMVKSKSGEPLYSWRVAILPFIEADAAWRQFKLDEPWDSPNNKRLLSLMPRTFATPGAKKDEPYTTHYQLLVGGGAMFDAQQPTRISHIPDGLSNTIMIVEAEEAVPWSKPADLTYSPKEPLPKFGGIFKNGFNAAGADGAVHFIPNKTPPDTLHALITRSGGEPIGFPDRPSMQKATYPRGAVKKMALPPKTILEKK
jgi:hypothetical protein